MIERITALEQALTLTQIAWIELVEHRVHIKNTLSKEYAEQIVAEMRLMRVHRYIAGHLDLCKSIVSLVPIG